MTEVPVRGKGDVGLQSWKLSYEIYWKLSFSWQNFSILNKGVILEMYYLAKKLRLCF